MARAAKNPSFDDLIAESVERVVQRVFSVIERQVDRAVAARVSAELKTSPRGVRGRTNGVRKARAKVEITSWVADRQARRVPNFVIEATGLDTKKRIVAKFGENAKFDKGKPVPKVPAASHDAGSSGASTVTARPPAIRKAAVAK